MNLNHITDKNLIEMAESNRSLERIATTESLHYLREIDTRRLFSTLGYPSIFEFAVKHLKHSEDEACRRISAMRLLREIPELETKINSGELTMTNLNQAQTLFRRKAKQDQKLTKQEKIDFISQIEGKSKRETEKIISEVSPEVYVPDRVRAISPSQILVSFAADAALIDKVERLKGLLAHSNPDISMGELTNWLCDIGIAALDKTTPAPARAKGSDQKFGRPLSKAAIRKAVWSRDNGSCQKCKSKYAVQIDHIKPKAMGGEDSLENLRLLCRKCNQRAAIEVYGRKKMGKFLYDRQVSYKI